MATATKKKAPAKAPAKKATPKRVFVYKLVKPWAERGVYSDRLTPPTKLAIGKATKNPGGWFLTLKDALTKHAELLGTGLWTVLLLERLDSGPKVLGYKPIKVLGTFNSNPGGTPMKGLGELTDAEFTKATKLPVAPKRKAAAPKTAKASTKVATKKRR
jgi:hypothetical protein